jgi:two-component system response regulator AtoC
MPRILVVEDEVTLANAMADLLAEAGHTTRAVYAGEKVHEACREFEPHVLLLDVRLGAVNGVDLIPEIKAQWPEVAIIVVTAFGDVDVAVEAMKRGASDFLRKPVDLDVLAAAVDKVWAASHARRRLEQFETAQQQRLRQARFVGECPAIHAIHALVDRLVERSAAAGTPPVSILLTGETGTGKDLLASVLHARLPQRSGPFVPVNCAAIPAELFESELFGHKRGAFSGATGDKPGLFETADGGTLMLDEVVDLPLGLQPKLLRVIETQSFRRVGETRDRGVSLCLIAATNRDLRRAVAEGRFREDLYYRLKVVTIELPPLRDRGDDIDLLLDHFCGVLGAKYGLGKLTLTEPARQAAREYPWPGNVRELLNALERAALVGAGPVIDVGDLPIRRDGPRAVPAGPAAAMIADLAAGRPIGLEALERAVLEQALEQTRGNVSAAARLLSIGREAMRYRLNKLGFGAERPDTPEDPNG